MNYCKVVYIPVFPMLTIVFCNLSVLIAAASVYVVVVEIAVESKNWFKMCILWFDL